jgi:recombination protein RecT
MTEPTNTEPLRAELERAERPAEAKTIVDLIERNEPELAKLLGPAMTVEQFKTAAMTYLRMQPKLYDCNPFSLVGGLRLGAQLGLSLGPLGHFYLVPFKREAVFILGYKGMIELAYRSEQVKDVKAGVVLEGDFFQYREGTRPFLDHAPSGPVGGREPQAWYAVARLRSGGAPFVVLYAEDMERARAQSPAAKVNQGPWTTHPRDMELKTAVRRLQRWIPQTRVSVLAREHDETIPHATDDEPGEEVLDNG